ncbi:ATP-binding protein [Variovorax sp. PBL-E5]|uniref:ATP-binding protein n=1 Tax=Variovorax sp. PBL-E5 TaxID=434014 RepID=UPI00131733DD|nr:ATP-binding protein [Variovorax sp. PBL-E5]VTU33179.1 Signal transduction histidine-protein kinase BaeS [Variovorax sp. PBL-E5]
MHPLTLSKKIFLALATLLVVLLLIFAGFSIFGLKRGLGPYVAEIEIRRMDWLAQILQVHYAGRGNWDRLRDVEAWRRIEMGDIGLGASVTDGVANDAADRRLPPWYARQLPPGFGNWPPPPPPMAGFFEGTRELPDSPDSVYQRLGLLDAAGKPVAGTTGDLADAARLPLHQHGRTIGYLVLSPLKGLESEADRAFLARQSGFVMLTGVAGLVFALAMSWLLARRWFAPIDDLMQGAESVARGRLGTRVPVRGSDELALLGRTFNSMAERLDTIDASRRTWLANAAHELRTPLAAMRAEIEALQDGVRSFDDKTALRLHRQVMRLAQLVDDLRSSMHEAEDQAPVRAPVFPLTVLAEALAATRARFEQHGIAIEAPGVGPSSAVWKTVVDGDSRQLHQVFGNLLENTLSYTDAGGCLRIDASVAETADGRRLVLHFDDSAPCPAPQDMPRLFDRLFRAEASRDRASGGSGLGLSICRTIVEVHGGSIQASASPLGGLRITLVLPLGGHA